jgi:hypothetical protein
MNNKGYQMSTQEQIAVHLDSIVHEHTKDDDGPCGATEDGNAIANSTFNYALSLAIEAAIANSVDLPGIHTPAHKALMNLVNELKAMKIPQ